MSSTGNKIGTGRNFSRAMQPNFNNAKLTNAEEGDSKKDLWTEQKEDEAVEKLPLFQILPFNFKIIIIPQAYKIHTNHFHLLSLSIYKTYISCSGRSKHCRYL